MALVLPSTCGQCGPKSLADCNRSNGGRCRRRTGKNCNNSGGIGATDPAPGSALLGTMETALEGALQESVIIRIFSLVYTSNLPVVPPTVHNSLLLAFIIYPPRNETPYQLLFVLSSRHARFPMPRFSMVNISLPRVMHANERLGARLFRTLVFRGKATNKTAVKTSRQAVYALPAVTPARLRLHFADCAIRTAKCLCSHQTPPAASTADAPQLEQQPRDTSSSAPAEPSVALSGTLVMQGSTLCELQARSTTNHEQMLLERACSSAAIWQDFDPARLSDAVMYNPRSPQPSQRAAGVGPADVRCGADGAG